MPFFIYLAQLSLYAMIMWGIYCFALRAKGFHTYSRIYLLGSLFVPMLLPLIHLPVSEQSVVANYQFALPEVVIGRSRISEPSTEFSWIDLLLGIYAIICLLLTVTYLLAYLRIRQSLRQGVAMAGSGYSIITNTGIGPGTLGRRIFFPGAEVNNIILQHELAHIRAGHRYDSALLQLMHVLFWISPAHWLIGRELKMVHEFEADHAAASSLDITTYSRLLLSQSLGSNRFSLAHSFFHHPLKRRIQMLQLSKHPKTRLAVMALASISLIVFSGIVLLAQTRKSQTTKKTSPTRQVISGTDTIIIDEPDNIAHGAQLKTLVSGTDTIYAQVPDEAPQKGKQKVMADGTVVYTSVDKMPEFNGNLSQWLAENLRYPDAARRGNKQGKAIIAFVIDENGRALSPTVSRSSGSTILDEEALRVVNAMPAWKAGMTDGQKVPVYFTLPIRFKLE
jgi:TonB family protein